MTDDHNSGIHLLYSMYTTCIHVVQRSAILADTDIRLIVKKKPVSVRIHVTLEKLGTDSTSDT